MLIQLGGGFAAIGDPPIAGTLVGPGAMYSLVGSGPPVDGVTGVGIVPNGGLYFDSTNDNPYLNIGIITLPVYSGLLRA